MNAYEPNEEQRSDQAMGEDIKNLGNHEDVDTQPLVVIFPRRNPTRMGNTTKPFGWTNGRSKKE